ncbi:U6 snRNA phosphodiesterase isoform X2 [Drosophila santomea]|uniref:U6 snRNA phosphodiesterase isoform X2 n=1 Tax=Drosophila santomea TaxID=129105 RepID=UPI00195419A5|nr:U6 snRNA phosphodiesterase isoform X2 [Drosophila santomea]
MALVDYGDSSSSASEDEDCTETIQTPALSSLKSRPAGPQEAQARGVRRGCGG